MAIQKSIVKMPLGMQTLDFWPIKEEPASSHPTYDESINLGAAVKGYLSITTASASIPGDDITQVEDAYGEILRSYISYIRKSSEDSRYYYKSGELATTATEKLRGVIK